MRERTTRFRVQEQGHIAEGTGGHLKQATASRKSRCSKDDYQGHVIQGTEVVSCRDRVQSVGR